MTPPILTRIFSLIPLSEARPSLTHKMKQYFVKFRNLENLFIKTLVFALNNEILTLEDFSGTNVSHIKRKIYNYLKLNQIKPTPFKSIVFKERVHRCAIIYPYHAVRNWLIRNENLKKILSEFIEHMSADPSQIVWFLRGEKIPEPFLKCVFHVLKKDIFGSSQDLTSYQLKNMIRQLRNIFFSNTPSHSIVYKRLQEIRKNKDILEQFLERYQHSFKRRKKRKQLILTLEQLPSYFLERYFRKIKWISTRENKKKMEGHQFQIFKQHRDSLWDEIKQDFSQYLSQFSKDDLYEMMRNALNEGLTDLEAHSSNHLMKSLFMPFFRRINLNYSSPTYEQFFLFFHTQLTNKMREMLHTLFLTESIATHMIAELGQINTKLVNYITIPHIKKLSIPIQNIKETHIYRSNLHKLTIHLSFVRREFHSFLIKDTKGRIQTLLEKGGSECPPVICYKQGKMLCHLPFEVKKTISSKQALLDKKSTIELGIDLGLKHFAVLSVMDKTTPKHPKELTRYFLGQRQLFDMNFNGNTGKFESRCKKPTNIKLKLIHLRSEVKCIQHKLHTYQDRLLQRECLTYKNKYKYVRLDSQLKQIWIKINNINKEIINLLSHTIKNIVKFHNISLIRVENLKWAHHSKRSEVGQFLAFWQTHWFYSQIQKSIEFQANLYEITFKRVNARNTSRKCSRTPHMGNREGKAFYCSLCNITLDSDLNAARNIALCPC